MGLVAGVAAFEGKISRLRIVPFLPEDACLQRIECGRGRRGRAAEIYIGRHAFRGRVAAARVIPQQVECLGTAFDIVAETPLKPRTHRTVVAPRKPEQLRAAALVVGAVAKVEHLFRRPGHMHRHHAAFRQTLLAAQVAEVGAQRAFEPGEHAHDILRRVSPIRWSFIPRAVVGGKMAEHRTRRGERALENLLRLGLTIRADGQRTEREAAVADEIPVVRIVLGPPFIRVIGGEARIETLVHDGVPNRREPRR